MSKAVLVENFLNKLFYDLHEALIIKNLFSKDVASDAILHLKIVRYNTQ